MTHLPRARAGLVRQPFAGEVLVYDESNHHAYSLDGIFRATFERCDGTYPFEAALGEIQGEFPDCTPARFEHALEELAKTGLIEPLAVFHPSRRALLHGLGIAGIGALGAVPAILTVLAPSTAHAASGCLPLLALCSSNGQCCSGHCGTLGINLVCL